MTMQDCATRATAVHGSLDAAKRASFSVSTLALAIHEAGFEGGAPVVLGDLGPILDAAL